MDSFASHKKPLFGTRKKLIDSIPFLGENKYAETWEISRFFLGFRISIKNKESIRIIKNDSISNTNSTFDYLKRSGDFLNILVNNLNSCILLLNKENRLVAFNDSLKTIFSNKKDEQLEYLRCGEAIGCAYQIEEQKECGNTSKCSECELRDAVVTTYETNKSIHKEHIIRYFFNLNNEKVKKHLQFSTHIFNFYKEKYVILLVEDISRFYPEVAPESETPEP